MSRYLVNARNRAESTEQSRFSPRCAEFCSVGSPRASHFRASHHSTYCARRSLTSYRPVVHTCSHFGARVRRRHMPRETARAPPQVPQHFDGARANGSLFAPPVDLMSFTSYGADWRTQDSEPYSSWNWDFLNSCFVGPNVGPEAELEVSSFLPHNLFIMMID